MSDVVDLAQYARRRESSANTEFASASSDTASWYKSVEQVGGGAFLSASVLRKLDIDSGIGRFVGLVYDALERLSVCQSLLASDALGADDHFIACKPIFAEMLMFRELSDAVGLISLKCLQTSASVKAIVDAPSLPSVLERALTRVCAAPFMNFEEACKLADEIEEVTKLDSLPGLSEVANELVESSAPPSD